MSRFGEWAEIGNDAATEEWGSLTPFLAHYEFNDTTHTITVWETCWADAHRHAQEHGMRIVGKITGQLP